MKNNIQQKMKLAIIYHNLPIHFHSKWVYIKNKPDPIFGFKLKSQLKSGSIILKLCDLVQSKQGA
jgi:hypothetical protein